jgi:hypothetical protein
MRVPAASIGAAVLLSLLPGALTADEVLPRDQAMCKAVTESAGAGSLASGTADSEGYQGADRRSWTVDGRPSDSAWESDKVTYEVTSYDDSGDVQLPSGPSWTSESFHGYPAAYGLTWDSGGNVFASYAWKHTRFILRMRCWLDTPPGIPESQYQAWADGQMRTFAGKLHAAASAEGLYDFTMTSFELVVDAYQVIHDPGDQNWLEEQPDLKHFFTTGKPLQLRVFILCQECGAGPVSLGNATATVTVGGHSYSTSNHLATATPAPVEGEARQLAMDALRSSGTQTFFVQVPEPWFTVSRSDKYRDVEVSLVVSFTPAGASGAPIDISWKETLDVRWLRPLRVGVFDVVVRNGVTRYSPASWVSESEFLEDVFPGTVAVTPLGKLVHDVTWCAGASDTDRDLRGAALLVALDLTRAIGRRGRVGAMTSQDYLFGYWTLPPEAPGMDSEADNEWGGHGYVAEGTAGSMAHEIGHMLLLRHTGWIPATETVNGVTYDILKDDCPSPGPTERSPWNSDDPLDYEWPHATEQTTVWGYRNQRWGVRADSLHDLMSYCTSDLQQMWISDAHYRWLLRTMPDPPHITKEAPASPSGVSGIAARQSAAALTGEARFVSALLVRDGTVHELRSLELPAGEALPRSAEPPGPSAGCFEARDAGGVVLDFQCFEVRFVTADTFSERSVVPLRAFLASSPAVATVSLTLGGTQVGAITRSAHPPAIAAVALATVSPGLSRLSWSATDEDGDVLTFAVEYSPDDGASWQPLAVSLREPALEVDVTALPAATAGRFRITASDGFRQTMAECATTLAVPNRAPTISLGHDERVEELRVGSVFLLSARATDIEDGPLPPAALHWRDGAGAALGDGDVPVVVSLGEATYTVTATDSAGATSQRSVTLVAANPFTISPTSRTHNAGGGTGTITVTGPASVAWSATANASWITVTGGSSGTGNGSVTYSVGFSASAQPRSGTVTVASRTFTVDQQGAPACSFTVSTSNRSHGGGAGTGTVAVTAAPGCFWQVVSQAPWISIASGATGSGNGSVSYALTANAGPDCRTGTITVAGKLFTVVQCAAPEGAADWTQRGLQGTRVQSLAIAPDAPATLYAGTDDGRIFKTVDGGTTWTPLPTGLGAYTFVRRIAVDPAAPTTVYAATSHEGVIKSTDGGATWAPAGTGLGTPALSCVALDPARPQRLYAAGGDVFSSDDGAASWHDANGNIADRAVSTLLVDPFGSGALWAGSAFGLHWTDDGGTTWVEVEPTDGCLSLAAHPSDPLTLYAGFRSGTLLVTNDGGLSFYPANSGLPQRDVDALCIAPGAAPAAYAATVFGVFRTVDGAATWQAFNNGLVTVQSQWVKALAVDPASPEVVYAGTGGAGVFATIPAGGSCSYVVTPASVTLAAAAGTATLAVAAPEGCCWVATTHVDWITIVAGIPGSGPGTVDYAVTANRGPARSGTITVGGQGVVVTQDVRRVPLRRVIPH